MVQGRTGAFACLPECSSRGRRLKRRLRWERQRLRDRNLGDFPTPYGRRHGERAFRRQRTDLEEARNIRGRPRQRDQPGRQNSEPSRRGPIHLSADSGGVVDYIGAGAADNRLQLRLFPGRYVELIERLLNIV